MGEARPYIVLGIPNTPPRGVLNEKTSLLSSATTIVRLCLLMRDVFRANRRLHYYCNTVLRMYIARVGRFIRERERVRDSAGNGRFTDTSATAVT